MPMHPEERSCTDTLAEDREAIILADKLGFYDAIVGEHLTEKTENVTNSLLFLATLISDTKTIKLGTSHIGERDLRHVGRHPLRLALTEAHHLPAAALHPIHDEQPETNEQYERQHVDQERHKRRATMSWPFTALA